MSTFKNQEHSRSPKKDKTKKLDEQRKISGALTSKAMSLWGKKSG
jgi:hypothetical protein